MKSVKYKTIINGLEAEVFETKVMKYITIYLNERNSYGNSIIKLYHEQKFIDVDNLEIYTIPELKSLISCEIRNAKKHHYIKYIKDKLLPNIISNNRELKIKELLK